MPRRGQIDPMGRVDILFSRIIERVAHQSGNPVVQGVYEQIKPALDNAIADKLGPRKTKLVRRVLKIMHKRGMVDQLAARIAGTGVGAPGTKGATQ